MTNAFGAILNTVTARHAGTISQRTDAEAYGAWSYPRHAAPSDLNPNA